MFLGYWIVTIFGSKLSGSHFNPAITIAAMFRSGEACLESKLLGVIYICGQFVGSIIAGFFGILLLEPKNLRQNYKCSIEPINS
jgi:glycerol uptake facilitator-like aquaporin